ncbi:hypothetical protein H8E07_22340 [bacterium]|nr:hypothetical protein [bacterium]
MKHKEERHMKKHGLISMSLILVLCSLVGAQPIDPHPDGMSIYCDLGATQFCYELQPGFQSVTAYLMLTRASTDQPHVLAWEARLLVDGNPTVPVPAAWTLPGPSYHPGSGADYIAGTTSPPWP